MSKRRGILAFFLVLVMAAAGYFLPTLLSRAQDRRIENGANTLAVEPIMLKSSVSSSLIQRLQIIACGSWFDTSGNYPLNYNQEEAKNVMLSEFLYFLDLSGQPIPDIDPDDGKSILEADCEVNPALYTDPRIAPGITVTAWKMSFTWVDDIYITLQMDELSSLLTDIYIFFPKGFNTQNDYYQESLYISADSYSSYLELSTSELIFEHTSDYESLYLYSNMYDPVDESLNIRYLFSYDATSFSITPVYYPDDYMDTVDVNEHDSNAAQYDQ